MIYLCSVYSYGNAGRELMQKRYEYAAMRTAGFMKLGHTIFCPINHCHPIAEKYDMPRTWDFWQRHDLDYISASDQVWVLMMPGWQESTGITAEIEYAKSIHMPIVYIPCDDYHEDIQADFLKVFVIHSKSDNIYLTFFPTDDNQVMVGITKYNYQEAQVLLDSYLDRGYEIV